MSAVTSDEAVIRADERLKVLREVRNTVARADRNTDDPYGWGYDGMYIVLYLSWLLGEQRRTMGLEPPRT